VKVAKQSDRRIRPSSELGDSTVMVDVSVSMSDIVADDVFPKPSSLQNHQYEKKYCINEGWRIVDSSEPIRGAARRRHSLGSFLNTNRNISEGLVLAPSEVIIRLLKSASHIIATYRLVLCNQCLLVSTCRADQFGSQHPREHLIP
jgi:hypothetical protein